LSIIEHLIVWYNWDDIWIEEVVSNQVGIIKSLIDGIASITNIEDVLMGEILQVVVLKIKASLNLLKNKYNK